MGWIRDTLIMVMVGTGMTNDDNGDEKRDETRGKISPGMIGPSHHYQHPYREEIETLEYRPRQLDVSGITPKDSNEIVQGNKMDDGVWICNEEEDLAQLAMRITNGIENGEIQEIRLRLELKRHSSTDVSITSVLDKSKRVCLIRYDKELFRPSGYLRIMDGNKNIRGRTASRVTPEFSSHQEAALKALYD